MFNRILKIEALAQQSFFLWGARQTGKSCYLKTHYPNARYYNFLDTKIFLKYLEAPYLFREELLQLSSDQVQQPIILDEFQKVPLLLNEVHFLIEEKKWQFILCGSSARKLRTAQTNLLGGRAWIYHFYPLVFPEIPTFDLLRALQHGLLPAHYNADSALIAEHHQAYLNIYLTDEIRNEGLVRNLASFSRFLEVVGMCNAELINMNNIARDCHVSRYTVQSYFQILVDTWLGYFIYPYHHKIKRDVIAVTPKFYFFDVGIANYMAHRAVLELKGEAAGKSLEHFILMELIAYREFSRKRFTISYWRTKTGLEVDFVLGDAQAAIEIKISTEVHITELRGLQAFCEEHPNAKAIVVSQDARPRQCTFQNKLPVTVLPWYDFLTRLWQGEIISTGEYT